MFALNFVRLLISSPIILNVDEGRTNSSTSYHETESSETSNSTILANLPSSSYAPYSSPPRTSYFNSAIETAIKQHLHDDEPIPFIDDNLSVTHSRKSSACWSDRTSLSSRFGFAWKLNLMRSGTQLRSPPSSSNETGGNPRRLNYRTMRYTIPPSQQLQFHDEL